jgi:hypothetical protein
MQTSFVSGELSPSMYARIDIDKWHQGAALLRNFFVDYRGGARNRAGSRWGGKTLGQNQNVRVVRFAFNSDQTYAMEFGHQYVRFIKNGGYIIEPAKNITAATKAAVCVITSAAHGITNGQWIYIDGLAGMVELNRRTFVATGVTANTINLQDVYGVNVNSTGYGVYTGAGTLSRIYTLTTPYVSADIFNLRFTQSADVVTITHTNYVPMNLNRLLDYSWTLAAVVIGTTQAPPTVMTLTRSANVTGTPAQMTTQFRYCVTAVSAANGDESAELQRTITAKDVFESVTMWVRLDWTDVPGAGYYNIYRAPYGKGEGNVPTTALFGLIGSSKGSAFVDKGFTADFSHTPPILANPLSGNNPVTSTYFQQRKIYGGSLTFPETFWTSQISRFNNLNTAIPLQQDNALTATLASLQVNAIKHMIPMPGGLITFTTGSVWQVSGGGLNTPITPNNILATPQGYNGIGELPPIPTNFNILYVQQKGAVVRDLSYNFFVNIYSSQDITTLSSHLFMGHRIVDWAFAEEPWKVFWLVREDGKMLSLTYLQESEVVAWCQHDTLGLVKSVCTISEQGEDFLYMVVERFNSVHGWVRHLERMESRVINHGLDDCWFLDAALEYPLNYLNATLLPQTGAGVVGTSVIMKADAAVFTAGMVGNYIRFRNGLAVVTAFTSTTQTTAQILQPFPVFDDGVSPYAPSGEWSCTAPVSVLKNLDHLEGQSVMLLADGGVVGPKTVTNGTVDLGAPASRIICGLPYKSQLGTLYLDMGDPNAQGRRKSIPAVTTRVEASRGLKAGPDLDNLYEMKLGPNPIWALGAPLVTDDIRLVIGSWFNSRGQVFIEQDYPLPATILGIIPEVWVGDTP